MIKLAQLINAIQLSIDKKQNFVIIRGRPSKFIKNFLEVLQQTGWIKNYYLNDNGYEIFVCVQFRFNYDRTNIIKSIKMIGSNKKDSFVSPLDLWKINKGQGMLLLNSKKGLITDGEARLYNLGGKLSVLIN